ncbi:hypothetical protein S245_004165 [Arachis hypogaea]
MASLLDKSELSIQRLIKLRNSVMRCTNRTHSNRLDVRFGDSEPDKAGFHDSSQDVHEKSDNGARIQLEHRQRI